MGKKKADKKPDKKPGQQEKKTTWPYNNPEGKGGFGDHPENRSHGRWSKENSFSYWMNKFKSLTVSEFESYNKTKSKNERTVAESLAFERVRKAMKDLKEFREVADRTEGKPKENRDENSDIVITPPEVE